MRLAPALATLLAVPALGFAQTDVLTISGIIDGGVRFDSGGVAGSVKSVGSGLIYGNRLNFAGIEDLGSGMRAAFVLEAGFTTDTGEGTANPPGTPAGPLNFGRTSALAIGGDALGYLSFGRQYTPLWAVSAGYANDPFAAGWLGGIGTVYSATVRASNSVVYSYGYGARTMLLPAPRKGLGVAAMWSLPEAGGAAAPSQSGQQLGFNLSYGNGTAWAGYGFHQVRGSNTAISATAPVTDSPRLRQQTLAASYVVMGARLNVGLNRADNGLAGSGAVDRRNWHVGAQIPIASLHVVNVLYGRANDRTAANADFTNFQLGYEYLLSKRTSLYAAVGQVDNSATARATPLGALGSYALGSTPRSAIAGLRHNF